MDLANSSSSSCSRRGSTPPTPADLDATTPADVQRIYDMTIVACRRRDPAHLHDHGHAEGGDLAGPIDGTITLDQTRASRTPASKW